MVELKVYKKAGVWCVEFMHGIFEFAEWDEVIKFIDEEVQCFASVEVI
jgi:hypothetical protein